MIRVGDRAKRTYDRPMRMSNARPTQHEPVLPSDVTIRPASADDDAELERLAQLDSARPIRAGDSGFRSRNAGLILVGKVGDELRAAYSVTERRAIANPFRRTAELVELLEVRAKQLNGSRRRRSPAPQPPGLGLGFSQPGLDRCGA
jgi:hypothetical protein